MKPVVVFYDVHPLDQTVLAAGLGSDYELVFSEPGLTADNANLAQRATVLSVHVTSKVTAELMQRMPDLKHVACRSTGFDNVDLAYTRSHNIAVSTVPAYGQETVAEYAVMLMLALSRQLVPAIEAVRDGKIEPELLTGHDLSGKTLGIISTGRIGQHVAGIARGFGMTVLGFDKYPNTGAASQLGFKYVELAELLAASDIITLHAPATPETFHMLSTAQFEAMKPGAVVINTARGSLIDTVALIKALESGRLAGAGLDVVEGEEYEQTEAELNILDAHNLDTEAKTVLNLDLLSRLPNVIITSHNAYNSAEALERIRQTTITNITAFQGQKPQNLVAP